MNALTLLHEVAEAYRALTFLEVEALHVTESGDEDSSQRGQQRLRFAFAAPDRFRFERCGKPGFLTVADGEYQHTRFPKPPHIPGTDMYNRNRISDMPEQMRLPNSFRPEFPFSGGAEAFLFPRIQERVTEASILREEEGCFVLSVSYEPSPHGPVVVTGPATLFWVRVSDRMVMRVQSDQGHRFPTEDDVSWTRHTTRTIAIRVNQPIADSLFVLTPPADAYVDKSGIGRISSSGGGGFIARSEDNGRGVEQRGSHYWEGETLVDETRWRMRGVTLTFQRRLTFSEDSAELHVGERLDGPKGIVEGNYSVRLKD